MDGWTTVSSVQEREGKRRSVSKWSDVGRQEPVAWRYVFVFSRTDTRREILYAAERDERERSTRRAVTAT